MCDSRAVSTAVSYVLVLGISALLVTGLLTAGGSYIEDQRERVLEDQLEVIGQQTAANIERADRMVRATDQTDPTVSLNQSLPNTVAGTTYRITLDSDAVEVTSADPAVTVSVDVATENENDLNTGSSASGGEIQIRYDDTDGIGVNDG